MMLDTDDSVWGRCTFPLVAKKIREGMLQGSLGKSIARTLLQSSAH
jgi:hypothetical protein